MKLRYKSFERAARHRIKAEIGASERLQEQYRHLRRLKRQGLQTRLWMARLFFTFLVGLSLFLRPSSSERVIAVIVLWQLSAIFVRASFLNGSLHYSPAVSVLFSLPISDQDIFKVQWQRFLRDSLWSVLDFSILYGLLAWKIGGRNFSPAIGIAFGIISWLFIIAMALSLYALGVRKFFFGLGSLFSLSAMGVVFFLPYQQEISTWIARSAYGLPPVGWLVHAMGITPAQGVVHDLVPCVLAAFTLLLSPLAYRRALRQYGLHEGIIAVASRTQATMRNRVVEYPEAAGQFTQTQTEAAAQISAGELQAGLDWKRLGPVERLVSRLLNPRERVITDFLVAGNPRWTAGLRRLGITLSFLLAGTWLFTSLVSALSGFLLVPVAVLLLAAFAGQWRGFGQPGGGGLQSPYYALYPLGFWELMRLVLKINLLRFLLYLPLVATGLILVVGKMRSDWASTIALGSKVIFLGLIAQPILAIAQISPGTNDGKKPVVILAALAFFILQLASGMTFIAAESPVLLVTSAIVSAMVSCCALLLYGRLYNKNRFDLLPSPAQTVAPH